jgi:hypothetical protein
MRSSLQPSSRGHAGLALVAVMAMVVSCAATQRGPQAPSDIGSLPVENPAPWERIVNDAYENRGVAQIERLGRQWLLNVMCDGTHATYIEEAGTDLDQYRGAYVSVRYRYVERTNADVRCVKEPCPPVRERRVALERVTRVAATPEDARDSARSCR